MLIREEDLLKAEYELIREEDLGMLIREEDLLKATRFI